MTQWRAENELGREFFQTRLALLGKLGLSFMAAFILAFNAVNLMNASDTVIGLLRNSSNQLHTVAAVAMGLLWTSCRTVPRSHSTLLFADAAVTWTCAGTFATAAWLADPGGVRNYAMLLEITNLLVMRAVIVPSTTVRTFWTGAAVLPMAAAGSYWFGTMYGPPSPHAMRHALNAVLFCSMAIAASTMTSRVIWILRRRVREALTVGQYTLVSKLGEGGMGVVYRARHSLLRRPTAVKILPVEKSADSARERFEREVQLTSQLTHPNTVAIYDYGHTPDGIFYYAMEYLDGIALDRLVDTYGPQPAARVVHILRQVCASLGEAHDLLLVHRDVKPANVMLCERWGGADVVKVVDFGLVKTVEKSADLTQEDAILGTPAYMAPEAITRPKDVGPPADLYAVGAVGYFLLTGRPPFEAETLAGLLTHHIHTQPTPLSQRAKVPVSEDLDELLLRCLAKDPEARPAGARALAEALAACPTDGDWAEADARTWWQNWREWKEASSPRVSADTTASTAVLTPLRVRLMGRAEPPESTTVSAPRRNQAV